MLIRFLFLVGFIFGVLLSGIYWQLHDCFYPLEKESWLWLKEYIKAYKTLPVFFTRQLFIIGIFMPVYLLLLLVFHKGLKAKTLFGNVSQKNLHGSARWASFKDIESASLASKEGVVVGGYKKNFFTPLKKLYHDGPEHILCFAPTGSGKGVGLVLPTLLSWKHSALVLDIKGENFEKTAGYRASIGQKILKFDPSAEFGSISFNPLAEIRLGSSYEIQDTQNIAAILLDSDGKGINLDHWRQNAFGWLTAGILYTIYKVLEKENRRASLYDVSCVMSGTDLEELLDAMLGFNPIFEDKIRTDVKTTIYTSAVSIKAKHDGERSGVHSTAITPLILYQDPIVAKNTRASDFKIIDLINKEKPVSLFIVLPPSQIDRLKSLFRITMDIILKKLTDKLPTEESGRLLLMLDEFTSIGKLEIFETSLAYMRGYGLKAYIIVQDLTQLQKAYSREESIISNCHIRIAYAPNKIETAKVLSDMSGKTTIIQQKSSSSKSEIGITSNISDSITETARPLLTPDECMQLKGAVKSKHNPNKVIEGGSMLIFPAGFAPIMGKQILYFQDNELLARSKITAPLMPEKDLTKQNLNTASQNDITKAIMGIA